MVHLDSTWSSCELQVDYAHKFGWATTKIKCTWSPPGVRKMCLDSSGVHLEYVGQGKVLFLGDINIYISFCYENRAWQHKNRKATLMASSQNGRSVQHHPKLHTHIHPLPFPNIQNDGRIHSYSCTRSQIHFYPIKNGPQMSPIVKRRPQDQF